MIFVWGSSSPAAAAEAAATPVPHISDVELTEGIPRNAASGHRVVANFAVRSRCSWLPQSIVHSKKLKSINL